MDDPEMCPVRDSLVKLCMTSLRYLLRRAAMVLGNLPMIN